MSGPVQRMVDFLTAVGKDCIDMKGRGVQFDAWAHRTVMDRAEQIDRCVNGDEAARMFERWIKEYWNREDGT